MYDAKGAASGVLLQIVQGLDKIRAAAAENRALGAWATRFADQASALLSSERLSAVRTAIYAMLPSFLIVIVFAGVSADPGIMTTAAVLAFITALGQIAAATAQLDLTLGYALNVLPLFDRMKPILAEPVEVAPGAGDPGLLAGHLELSAVSYRYPGMDRSVLHEVSITAEPGQFIALVGPSGSGKSTIVRLLLGFDRPESGTVSYDGKDLGTLDTRAVRAQIGVALQNAAVTGADLLSVITGDWPLTEEDAWAAAAKVGLADDIRALPMGMRTMVGDNAVTFSGGQRQRLVLAAAIARQPRLVILDEATSALDSITQAQVSQSFERLQVTRVVVAHRLGTIRNADKIFVLDGGRVVQEGRFEELASMPGIFQNMVRRQTL
jgi:ABC-type bacteriocin/lantibiotic exporter with double-glycine peptidase domain